MEEVDLQKHFDILELDYTSDIKSVKKRYIELSKIYHPDNYIESEKRKLAEDKFKEINCSYHLISNYINNKFLSSIEESLSSKPNYTEKKSLDISLSFYKNGIQFFKKGDINSALECFIQAHRKDENNIEFIKYIIKCLMFKDRRLSEAREYCQKLIKLEEFYPEHYFTLGKINLRLGLKSTALSNFKKSKELGYQSDDLDKSIANLEKKPSLTQKIISLFSK